MRPKLDYKRSRNHFVTADIIADNVPAGTFVDLDRDVQVNIEVAADLSAPQRRKMSKPFSTNIWVGSFAEYAQTLALVYTCWNYNPDFLKTVIRGWSEQVDPDESFVEFLEKSFRWLMELEFSELIVEYSPRFELLKFKYTFNRGEQSNSDFLLIDVNRAGFSKYVYDFTPEQVSEITDWQFGQINHAPGIEGIYNGIEHGYVTVDLDDGDQLTFYAESKVFQIVKEGFAK